LKFVERKFALNQRRRGSRCEICHPDNGGERDVTRTLYVRFNSKFVPIGWIFEDCGHIKIDAEKYRSLVEVDEQKVKDRKELAAIVAKDEEYDRFVFEEGIREQNLKNGVKMKFTRLGSKGGEPLATGDDPMFHERYVKERDLREAKLLELGKRDFPSIESLNGENSLNNQ